MDRINSYGEVFVWGGDQKLPQLVVDLKGEAIGSCAAQHEDSLVILGNGAIHTFGDSGFASVLQKVEDIVCIAFGDGHTLAIAESGRIVCAGSNTHGQSGTGAGDRLPVSVPTTPPALVNRKIVKIAAGQMHSVALSDIGDVYTWGRGFEGQLGHGNAAPNEIAVMPRLVLALAKKGPMVHIAASKFDSGAVSKNGLLFTWGDGGSGQLGYGKCTSQSTPKVVPLSAAVTSLAIGTGHMGVVMQGGEVRTWGLNVHGQLGHHVGPTHKYVEIPTEPEIEHLIREVRGDAAKTITAGPLCTFLVTQEGRVITWGSTENSLLGYEVDNAARTSIPRVVKALQKVHVHGLACSRKEVLAFIPQMVLTVNPGCAVRQGGTKLSLTGTGFPRTNVSCTVKFTIAGCNPVSVPGSYSTNNQVVSVEVPVLPAVGKAEVVVSFNKGPWCTAKPASHITIYEDFEWHAMTPSMGSTLGGTEILLEVMGLFDTPEIIGRIIGADGESKPLNVKKKGPTTLVCVTPAWSGGRQAIGKGCRIEVALNGQDYSKVPFEYLFYPPPRIKSMKPVCMPHDIPVTVRLHGTQFFDPPEPGQIQVKFTDKADGTEIILKASFRFLGVNEEISCDMPVLPRGTLFSVALSLNGGHDWTAHTENFQVYEPIQAVKSSPTCGPLDGGTVISITGSGLFDSGSLTVRLSDSNKEIFCPGSYRQLPNSSKGCMEVISPVWVNPPSTPTADPAAVVDPVVAGTQSAAIAISLNGKNFQPFVTPFTFYALPKMESVSILPKAAQLPDEGRPPVTFSVDGERLYKNAECKLKLTWKTVDPNNAATEQICPVKLVPSDDGVAPATMTFVAPEAIAGEATVQLALNGQQFIPLDVVLLFSVDPPVEEKKPGKK